jgi:co-chaperonin GroES (HSP10)
MRFKLYGERILVEQVQARQGTLFVPESAQDSDLHRIGRVVATGDGKFDGKDFPMPVKVDDLVYFQINAVIAAHCCFEVPMPGRKSKSLVNLDAKDAVAKLDTNEVTRDGFHVLGKWVLLKPFLRSTGQIVLPGAANDWQFVYYRIDEVGGLIKNEELVQGQEVVIVHGHANPIQIAREDYAYIAENDIHGLVYADETDEVENSALAVAE